MKKLSRRSLIIIAAAVLLFTGSASAWYAVNKSNDTPANNPQTPQAATDDTKPDVPGPTEQEKQDAEQHKEDVIKQQQVENTPNTGQKTVTPIITNASQNGQEIFASSYVSGVFENGGTCTFTFSKGSLQIVKTSAAFANASTTSCTNVTLSRSEFAEGGSWNLTVSYTSSAAQGASQPKAFTVQ